MYVSFLRLVSFLTSCHKLGGLKQWEFILIVLEATSYHSVIGKVHSLLLRGAGGCAIPWFMTAPSSYDLPRCVCLLSSAFLKFPLL
jgi:hypothetical protein